MSSGFSLFIDQFIMYINPAFLFLLVWILPLIVPNFAQFGIIQEINNETYYLVISNIVIFFILFQLMKMALGGYKKDFANILSSRINIKIVERRVIFTFRIWIIVYLINIFFSGGLPIYWVISGDSRTYADFGLPTLGGLGNMLRAFILSVCYFIYFHTQSINKIKFLKIGLFLLISAFIFETGRGNGVVLLLHAIAFFAFLNKVSWLGVLKLLVSVFALTLFLGYIQMLRYGAGIESLIQYAENSGFDTHNAISLLLIPTLMYVVAPIINVDLNIVASPLFKLEPYYSLQSLLPTVLRQQIFSSEKDYGLLISEANNVSSFYIPFIRDFGLVGAFIVVTFIQFIVCYVYVKARRGSLFHFFIWPSLFMSIFLSFFSLFFTSLVVLLYPVLVWFFLKGLKYNNGIIGQSSHLLGSGKPDL
jgi:oligosaccharide repeat unit polymerase